MIIRRFLVWVRTAPAAERAQATHALARAYLKSPLAPDERVAAEAAMTVLLDDASPMVRYALADVLAPSLEAPRHVIIALAADQPEIAALVLQRSPLLLDSELVDILAKGDERIQIAVGDRRPLSLALAAALAEVGTARACAALLENDAAEVAVFSLARLAERHGEDAVVRDLLLARDDLPVSLRQRLLCDLSNVLGAFLAERSWLSPARATDITRDALDRATLTLAETHAPDAVADLVEHLADTGQLTPVLILRALCAGNVAFLEEALVRLTGLPRRKVYALVGERNGQGFQALYRRAGLPLVAYPAFQVALDVISETEMPDRPPGRLLYSRQVLERVLTRYQGFTPDETDHLLLLLRRLAAEAAREEARRFTEAYTESLSAPPLLEPPQAA